MTKAESRYEMGLQNPTDDVTNTNHKQVPAFEPTLTEILIFLYSQSIIINVYKERYCSVSVKELLADHNHFLCALSLSESW